MMRLNDRSADVERIVVVHESLAIRDTRPDPCGSFKDCLEEQKRDGRHEVSNSFVCVLFV
jgi:hypothetical protein